MDYLNAFLCGGILCAVGQILIDKTPLTPARILTGYVVAGVLLTAVGVYEPIVEWGGAGATVPLTGFGYSLASGVKKAVAEQGWLGVMTGGLSATAGGIAAAVFAGETLLFFRIECAHGSVCAKFTRVPAPRLFRRRRTVCKSVQRYGLFFTICHIFAIYLIAYEIQF